MTIVVERRNPAREAARRVRGPGRCRSAEIRSGPAHELPVVITRAIDGSDLATAGEMLFHVDLAAVRCVGAPQVSEATLDGGRTPG